MSLPDELSAVGRLSGDWAAEVLDPDSGTWPKAVRLRAPDVPLEAAGFAELRRWIADVDQTAALHGLAVERRGRRIGGIVQQVPHRLVVPDLEHAVRVAGDGLPALIAYARHRVGVLGAVPSASVVRKVAALSELDFELLLAVLAWLREHDETGMTPRQLAIEGVHGKWLESHGKLVQDLIGRPLQVIGRASIISITWLDPEHRRAGRRHDAYTVGDEHMRPPYPVRLAIICENKDTAVHFPLLPGAATIEGNGTNLARLSEIPWLEEAQVVYWGDIDAAGYGIVHQLRSQQRDVPTLLMDEGAAERYSHLGVRHQPNGDLIGSDRRQLLELSDEEQAVYQRITEPGRTGWLRIEQERIPYAHALEALRELRLI